MKAAYMPAYCERSAEGLVAESMGVVLMTGERRDSGGQGLVMGVDAASGLDGGVSASVSMSEEEQEEDAQSSVVVSIGVIDASMHSAVLSTWRSGEGR